MLPYPSYIQEGYGKHKGFGEILEAKIKNDRKHKNYEMLLGNQKKTRWRTCIRKNMENIRNM